MMDVEIPALPPAAVADDGGDGGMSPLAATAAAAAEAAAPAAPPAQAVRYVSSSCRVKSCRVKSCSHHMPLRTPSCFGRLSSSLCSFPFSYPMHRPTDGTCICTPSHDCIEILSHSLFCGSPPLHFLPFNSHSFFAVRPPMGPTESPSDVSNWGIFPTQAAAEAYAATFASSSSTAAAADTEGAGEGEGSETASTVQSFSDAMSAIVYASRGTVVISRKKKKRKKRDGESGAGSGFTAVYKGGAGGGTWTWTLLS